MLAVVRMLLLLSYLFILLNFQFVMKKITSAQDLSHNLYYEKDFDPSSFREFLDSLSFVSVLVQFSQHCNFKNDDPLNFSLDISNFFWSFCFRFNDDTSFTLICHTSYVLETYLPLLRKMYVSEEFRSILFNFKSVKP